MTVTEQQILPFLTEFTRWTQTQSDILAAALVGSHARNQATAASDIDLIIVAGAPKKYLEDTTWAQVFGTVIDHRIENYGKVTSLRVWYAGSHEVEYGFTDATWPHLPLDEGTKLVVSSAIKILFERESILSQLKEPR